MTEVDTLIAQVLCISPTSVQDHLSYQSIVEWDSIRHVQLLVALERRFGVVITDELTLRLDSVRAIRALVESHLGGTALPSACAPTANTTRASEAVHRGLEGITVDHSSITCIDGDRGELLHRGYSVHDLVERSTFEETVWLLIHGELPDTNTLQGFALELRAARAVPEPVLDILHSLADAHPVEALRTAVSALGALEGNTGTRDQSLESARRQGIRLIAQAPTLIAAHHAFRSGRLPPRPRDDLWHAANFLYMLFAADPVASSVRFVDMDLIVHADHSSNASAFAARVAIGARSSIHAAITSAIATFAGPLHGGAAERVLEFIDEVGCPEKAREHVARTLDANRPVMGFGHRVYRTEDPRVRHIREAARSLAEERGDLRCYDTIQAIVEAMAPYSRHGLAPNVDLYAGLAYRVLGLADDLAVPMFIAGRMAGWVAQCLEQKQNNVLIRPLLRYAGAAARPFPERARP